MARPGKGLGDFGAETFRRRPMSSSVRLVAITRQIQRRMLAMMAICASQPAVKVSVRAAGMPAE